MNGAYGMTDEEMRRLQVLAGRANYLARLRDERRIGENEYIARLNELRLEHGLWPLQQPNVKERREPGASSRAL